MNTPTGPPAAAKTNRNQLYHALPTGAAGAPRREASAFGAEERKQK